MVITRQTMNPKFAPEQNRMWHELTEEERRKQEVKAQLAVNKLEGMEHHIPPRKGEHCYFNSSRDRGMDGMIPLARYVCQTDQGGVGVDFSVDTPVDTYYTHYHYQGKLETIKHDHGMGPLYRQRMR
jgi:hypothetical protein